MGRCAVGVTNDTWRDPRALSWSPLFVMTSFLTSPSLLLGCEPSGVHLTPGKVSLDFPGKFVLAGEGCISSVKSVDKGLLTGAGTPRTLAVLSMGNGGSWAC